MLRKDIIEAYYSGKASSITAKKGSATRGPLSLAKRKVKYGDTAHSPQAMAEKANA